MELTDIDLPGRLVSQVFCLALPVAYGRHEDALWARFATLVLEATYEATLLAARLNRAATGCALVYLTCVGGGAFGNQDDWIDQAMTRALARAGGTGLDVRFVSHGPPSAVLRRLAAEFDGA